MPPQQNMYPQVPTNAGMNQPSNPAWGNPAWGNPAFTNQGAAGNPSYQTQSNQNYSGYPQSSQPPAYGNLNTAGGFAPPPSECFT